MQDILTIATRNDAVILTDRDGDIAILKRHYDADGIAQPRHKPDPADYLPVSTWLAMTADQADAKVC